MRNPKNASKTLSDEDIDKLFTDLNTVADILLGPFENMDEERVRRYAPEVFNKPPGYFRAMVRKAAEEAALQYMGRGEPIPPHVRSALGGDWQKADAPKNTLE